MGPRASETSQHSAKLVVNSRASENQTTIQNNTANLLEKYCMYGNFYKKKTMNKMGK
jgi:hypothetical protein